jgi:glycosyltransferase involved in cell wall biosynthesis
VFLFTFDVSSQMARKNPLGVVTAFRSAFASRRDVVLLLKFTNAEYDPSGVRALYRAVDGLNAVLLDGYMDRHELTALMACADCYVSLHRSEGFGLGIAEAMALGKPVIATGYSGPVDFMTPQNSYMVGHTVAAIGRDYGPYLEGFSWADPDLSQASLFMRQVVESPADSKVRGRQAAMDIAEHRAPARTGMRVRRRLEEIRSGRVKNSAL